MSRFPPIPRSYEEAAATLGTRFFKYVGYNTELRNRNAYFEAPTIALTLHGTIIVAYQENTWSLYAGGYFTQTTKNRMSQALPVGIRLWSKEGRWYVGYEDVCHTFAEGMKITKVGDNYEFSGTGQRVFLRADRKLRRRISDYSKLCSEVIPLPRETVDQATCAQCNHEYSFTLSDTQGVHAGHLDSHMAQKEVPFHLLYKALNDSFVPSYCYDAVDGGRPVAIYRMNEVRKEIRRSMQRYLLKRFGFLV